MLSLNTLGTLTRPRTALAFVAATLILGGTATEASAKSRHHRHHHQARAESGSDWRNANASVTPSSGGRSFSGMASYYGNESGSRTASGARFNQNALTAAHRSLPFGTRLRVTHRGQSVIVTINDRGPFVRGRVLDLSTGAARAIGLNRAGVGRVTAEVVS
ncbi:septal ring lytic transglycosylase RlpA family protein [Bradyrhizobium diazoefficiens]|nr:septal ring lytic transglycosylase RlpA family protein [Bradyrhizobium diazoefficiens]MBR0776776.1 septal ring lytic transglycosylase RlpA family protein [Bradyrhizobium diazoefficiens]MBR0851144.1 septal ring lytic transglycosylase RlpA family protein [Bradyrhizobium diazoefficiens]